MMRRFYQLLDVSEDATDEQIDKAYKRMASKHHPDKNIGNEAEASRKFQEVKEAYECLSDPERRKAYDETGDSSVETGNPAEDLLIHILNELVDQFDTISDLLARCADTMDDMIQEVREKDVEARKDAARYELMLKALRYKGKGVNLIEAILKGKMQDAIESQDHLKKAMTSALAIKEQLKDYSGTDRRSRNDDMTPQERQLENDIRSQLGRLLGGNIRF